MSEHERTLRAPVSAHEAFQYLSSVSNLPNFVPHLSSLREDEENHVSGITELGEGHRHEVSGFFRPDEPNLRIDWESDGTPDYRGWLRIDPESHHRCRITVHIAMQGAASEDPPPGAGLAADRIERTFDSVMKAMTDALRPVAQPSRPVY